MLVGLISVQEARAQSPDTADTFIVRSVKSFFGFADQTPPATILGSADVGQRYCYPLHCVVYAPAAAHQATLTNLEKAGIIFLEPLPDAHTVFFENGQYDAAKGNYNRDFPGKSEVGYDARTGHYVVVFKSYPERGWLDQLEKAGLTVLEPLPAMGYGVYGPRTLLADLPKRFPFVYAVTEIPAGIKRFNIDTRTEGDDNGPASTTIGVVAKGRDAVLNVLRTAGQSPIMVNTTGSVEAYNAVLTRDEASLLSRLPEVSYMWRETIKGGPSDERSNRIVGGTLRTPGTSWPTTLGQNTTPAYSDGSSAVSASTSAARWSASSTPGSTAGSRRRETPSARRTFGPRTGRPTLVGWSSSPT